MDAIVMFTVLLLSLLGQNSALSYSFITKPQDLEVKEGTDVLLQCRLEGIFDGTLMWINGSSVFSINHNLLYPIPRLSMEGEGNVYDLRIEDVSLTDEGDWECQVPGLSLLRQINTVTIIIAPSITTTPDEGAVEVMEGESLTLVCDADGKPEPNVTWTKQGEDFRQFSAELSFGAITRDNSGTYKCSADNGVDDGDEAIFDVDVMFGAMVEVREQLVHTGPGDDVSLTCFFTSNPAPHIIWQLNNEDINVEEGGRVQVNNHESDDYELTSTLEILSLKATDLGVYSCNGGNGKGVEVVGSILLSGLPDKVTFESETDSDYSDTYTLRWEFFSVADPTECELKVADSLGNPFGTSIVPSKRGVENLHFQEFRISGLEVDSEYGASVNCKNEFGETGTSEVFTFRTSEEENPAPLVTTTLEPETERATENQAQPTTLPQIPVETTSVKAMEITMEAGIVVGSANAAQSWCFGFLMLVVTLLICIFQ